MAPFPVLKFSPQGKAALLVIPELLFSVKVAGEVPWKPIKSKLVVV